MPRKINLQRRKKYKNVYKHKTGFSKQKEISESTADVVVSPAFERSNTSSSISNANFEISSPAIVSPALTEPLTTPSLRRINISSVSTINAPIEVMLNTVTPTVVQLPVLSGRKRKD